MTPKPEGSRFPGWEKAPASPSFPPLNLLTAVTTTSWTAIVPRTPLPSSASTRKIPRSRSFSPSAFPIRMCRGSARKSTGTSMTVPSCRWPRTPFCPRAHPSSLRLQGMTSAGMRACLKANCPSPMHANACMVTLPRSATSMRRWAACSPRSMKLDWQRTPSSFFGVTTVTTWASTPGGAASTTTTRAPRATASSLPRLARRLRDKAPRPLRNLSISRPR